MPVEIRELHIRVNVNQPTQQSSAPAAGADAAGGEDKESLPAQLLDEILEVIKNKDER